MSKKVLMDAFFNQFSAFLKELTQLYPEDADFPIFQSSLGLLKTTNPMLVVRIVKDEVLSKYGDKIKAKDESFFMSHSYEDHKGDVDLDIVHKLKGYISGMSPSTKEAVWKYIEILTQLCERILQIS